MLQVMQDRRKATEAANSAAMASRQAELPQGETMDERKARLKAQRDLLRQIKEEKRQKELSDFEANLNAPNKPSLAEEFKNMDANKQLPQGSNPEMDRRRMIYKNVRKDIADADALAKQKTIAEKMSAMEVKVKQRE